MDSDCDCGFNGGGLPVVGDENCLVFVVSGDGASGGVATAGSS